MKNPIIEAIENEQMDKEVAFGPGDTLVVQVKVKEGNRERLQAFEGVVIAKRNRGVNSAFTVRKISHGVGVERTFQTFSKLIDSITVKRRGDVRKPSCTTCVSAAAVARVSVRSWILNKRNAQPRHRLCFGLFNSLWLERGLSEATLAAYRQDLTPL